MSTHHLDALKTLDWQHIQCQDPNHRCRNKAVFIVEYHAADDCIDETLNADGNRVEILCHACYRHLQHSVTRYLKRVAAFGRRPKCLTCGCPVAAIEDIIRGRTKL